MCDSRSVRLVSSLVAESRFAMAEAIGLLESSGEDSTAIAFFSPIHAALFDLEAGLLRSASVLTCREMKNDSDSVGSGRFA